MSILQLLAGVACASGILFLMWKLATIASRYMIRHAEAPVGLSLLSHEPSGVRADVSLSSGESFPVWHRGSGQAVMILPESGFKASAYTPIWSFLCGYGFRVILPDTGTIQLTRTPEEAAEIIQAICLKLRISSPLIIGHGMGSYQALAADGYLRNQGNSPIQGLISVSGFSGFSRQVLRSKFERLFQRSSSYQLALSAFGDNASAAGILAFQQHTTQQIWQYLGESWSPACSFYSSGRTDLPMKIISSIYDEILPFSHAGELNKISSASELIHVKEGAGHMLIWEKPTLITDQVRLLEKEMSGVMTQTG